MLSAVRADSGAGQFPIADRSVDENPHFTCAVKRRPRNRDFATTILMLPCLELSDVGNRMACRLEVAPVLDSH
jgi:hypothetical protein